VTTSYSPLSPVSVAVYTALNVGGLTALATGGVHEVIPDGTAPPYVLYELNVVRQFGGLGTWPGHGDMPGLELRVHAFTAQENISEGQGIVAKAIELLFTTSLSVVGYTVCSDKPMSEIEILNLGDQVVANVTVHEEVAIIQLIVENVS
jgi:hypothetical protein